MNRGRIGWWRGSPGNQEVLLFGLGQAVVRWSLECILSESRPWGGLTAEAGQRVGCSEAPGTLIYARGERLGHLLSLAKSQP